jgi:hypothetical protein
MTVKVKPGGKKMKVGLLVLAFATGLVGSRTATAQNWNFTFTEGSIVADGTLTTTLISPGVYGITGGTITLTGGGIPGSGVVLSDPNGAGNLYTIQDPPNSGGANLTADNLLYLNGNPQLDGNGFNFELTSYVGHPGGIYGAIWGNGPGNYSIFEGDYNIYTGGGNFSAPEGGASLLYLLIAGAACFGGIIFSSRNRLGSHASA